MSISKPSVVLTVDVEDWFHTNGLNFPIERWATFEDRVVNNTLYLLDLFDHYQAKGTFFILGATAEKFPELVLEIHKRGHEIGCHSFYHRLIYTLDHDEVISDIQKSKALLEAIIKESVVFFRAPSWSIGKKELWLIKALDDMGFKYDSSLQPFETSLSGLSSAPLKPFKPIINGDTCQLIEFPVTVLELGPFRIPFSGGFYMRAVPYWFFKMLMKHSVKRGPSMVYLHPWEFDQGLPKIKASLLNQLIYYFNLKSYPRKLNRFLSDFHGVSMSERLIEEVFETHQL